MKQKRNFKPQTDRKRNLSPSPFKKEIQRNFGATDPKKSIEQLKKHFQKQISSNTSNSKILPWNQKDKQKHLFQQRLQTKKAQLSSNYRQQYQTIFETQKNQQQKLNLRHRLNDYQNNNSQGFLNTKDQLILLKVKQMEQLRPSVMKQFLIQHEDEISNLQIHETRFIKLTEMNKSIQNSNINDNYLNQIKNRAKTLSQQQQVLTLEINQLEKEQSLFENVIKELIKTHIFNIDNLNKSQQKGVSNQKLENINSSLLSLKSQSWSCSEISPNQRKQTNNILVLLENQKSYSKQNDSILRHMKENPKRKNKKNPTN